MVVYALDLAAIGITNQRATTIVWERKTGKPIANAIVRQHMRVRDDVRRFSTAGGQERFRPQTGLSINTYFTGLKLRWSLQHIPFAREKWLPAICFSQRSIPSFSRTLPAERRAACTSPT